MSDFISSEKPTCPYCGHVHKDDWDIEFHGLEGDRSIACHYCGKDFWCSKSIKVYYVNLPKEK